MVQPHCKALYKGTKIYRTVCQKHHRRRIYARTTGSNWWFKEMTDMSRRPCIQCGWNESFVDRDRITPASAVGGYVKGNVVPLCPNCHRIKTLGMLLPSKRLLPLKNE